MKIRLGPLPRTEPIRLAISIPTALKARLDQYARMHAQVWGGEPVDAATLIPHMLEQFMARDRAFNAALKSQPGHSRRADGE
jgi:hypothetical protein